MRDLVNVLLGFLAEVIKIRKLLPSPIFEVFVSNIEEIIRIRTEERGEKAV